MTKKKSKDEGAVDAPEISRLALPVPTHGEPGEEDVVDATTLDDNVTPESRRDLALRRRWFDPQLTLVRFVTRVLVPASIHTYVPAGSSKLTLHCNGQRCVLCMAKHKPTPIYQLPVYFIDDRELAVIEIEREGKAGGLRSPLVSLLKQANFSDLIVEISRKDGRYHVAVIRTLDDTNRDEADYGDDALRDLAARRGVEARDVRAVVERRDNQTLLSDLDWLARKIRLYHPGLDLSAL
ncbi:MAG: hypothetical protein EPO40_22030 [Myxococcaceae bacterium]|nr:MAG: hypothetical protein EPO40_22030 [Myxococcaceae bacterium]